MKPEWIKFNGSDEQIAEMRNAKHGFIIDNGVGIRFMQHSNEDHLIEKPLLGVKKYLIFQPYPYLEMIDQWRQTGQPVYWRSKTGGGTGKCYEYFPPFVHPDAFEYSFTPFEEEA